MSCVSTRISITICKTIMKELKWSSFDILSKCCIEKVLPNMSLCHELISMIRLRMSVLSHAYKWNDWLLFFHCFKIMIIESMCGKIWDLSPACTRTPYDIIFYALWIHLCEIQFSFIMTIILDISFVFESKTVKSFLQ